MSELQRRAPRTSAPHDLTFSRAGDDLLEANDYCDRGRDLSRHGKLASHSRHAPCGQAPAPSYLGGAERRASAATGVPKGDDLDEVVAADAVVELVPHLGQGKTTKVGELGVVNGYADARLCRQ